MKIKIEDLKKTCDACPSQWEGYLEDGRQVYIRYRWSRLSVRISHEPTDEEFAAVRGEEIYADTLDEGGWAGYLEDNELRKILKMVTVPKLNRYEGLKDETDSS